MRPEWKHFLSDNGAEFEDERVLSFGNPERERRITTAGEVFCDLSHFGLISAHGEDAASFLQAQFSNDVRRVDDNHSQLSSYCTPKGRMLANFRLFRRGDTYYLRLPQSLVEPMLKRLRMYVLRSKVTLENADDALVRIGCSGPDMAGELARALGRDNVPEHADEALTLADLTVIRVPGIHPRFEIHGELEAVQSLWTRLNVNGAPLGADCWGLLDVLAGVPNVYPQTSEAFVPQMANMDLLGGVSFEKGCYPGQEIVARTRYLGILKRRMYLFHGEVESVSPGQEIFDAAQAQEERVGLVVEGYRHPDGGVEGLAVLQIKSAEDPGAKLRLDSPRGPRLAVRPPPYPLTLAEEAS